MRIKLLFCMKISFVEVSSIFFPNDFKPTLLRTIHCNCLKTFLCLMYIIVKGELMIPR